MLHKPWEFFMSQKDHLFHDCVRVHGTRMLHVVTLTWVSEKILHNMVPLRYLRRDFIFFAGVPEVQGLE